MSSPCASRSSKFRFLLIALTAAGVLASGCSSKYGAQTTTVNYYPDCYQPISELRSSEHTVAKSTATGAVLGAAIGALGGYLITGKGSGAAVGAAAGAAVGGAAGYAKGSADKRNEDAARLAEYNSRLEGSIAVTDRATAAARVARQCYDRQFTVAVSEYKAGHITKAQFTSRYSEVVSGIEEAARILGQVGNESAQVAAQYRQAVNQEAQRLGVPQESVSRGQQASGRRPGSRQTNASARLDTSEGRELNKMADRTAAMEDSASKAKEEERLLRERLAAYQRQNADLMS